jgi:hypothetical protein
LYKHIFMNQLNLTTLHLCVKLDKYGKSVRNTYSLLSCKVSYSHKSRGISLNQTARMRTFWSREVSWINKSLNYKYELALHFTTLVLFMYIKGPCNSASVVFVTGRLHIIRVQFLAGTEYFSFCIQISSGAHPNSYPLSTRCSSLDGKTAGKWRSPLTSIWCRSVGNNEVTRPK